MSDPVVDWNTFSVDCIFLPPLLSTRGEAEPSVSKRSPRQWWLCNGNNQWRLYLIVSQHLTSDILTLCVFTFHIFASYLILCATLLHLIVLRCPEPKGGRILHLNPELDGCFLMLYL